MRHPFDGIPGDSITRRAALGLLGSAIGGGTALAQVTRIRGEVGGPAIATTLALGEEGAGNPDVALVANVPVGPNGPVTTEPFGEEAGKVFSQAIPGLEDGRKAEPKPDNGQLKPTDAVNENGNKVTTLALGEEGGEIATSMALAEEGAAPITRAVGEAGAGNPGVAPVAIVPVAPNTLELNEARTQAAWRDLADKDVSKAVQASALLYGSKSVISFFGKTLKQRMIGVASADDATTAKLVADLDHDDFKIREQAETELSKIGIASIEIVEKNMETTKSAEMRMRLLRIRDAIKNPPQVTQARRAMEILVALRTPEAKDLLTKLADGDTKDWMVRQAKTALEQIAK